MEVVKTKTFKITINLGVLKLTKVVKTVTKEQVKRDTKPRKTK